MIKNLVFPYLTMIVRDCFIEVCSQQYSNTFLNFLFSILNTRSPNSLKFDGTQNRKLASQYCSLYPNFSTDRH